MCDLSHLAGLIGEGLIYAKVSLAPSPAQVRALSQNRASKVTPSAVYEREQNAAGGADDDDHERRRAPGQKKRRPVGGALPLQ